MPVFQQAEFSNLSTSQLFQAIVPLRSTTPNPLSGLSSDWAWGINITPASGNAWTSMTGPLQIYILTGVAAGNFTDMYSDITNTLNCASSTPPQAPNGAFLGANVINGVLVGLSPGSHQIVAAKQNGFYQLYWDGVQVANTAVTTATAQGPVFYFGQDDQGNSQLSNCNLSNFRFDPQVSRVIFPAGNPGAAGKYAAANLGDSITMGFNANANQSSFSTQIANADFNNRYWFMAGKGGLQAAGLSTFWTTWGTNQNLTKATVMIGVNDMIAGFTGAATWATIQTMLDSMRANTLTRIVLCTVTPFGLNSGWSSAKETQRLALNTSITNYANAHGPQVKLADASTLLQDGVTPANMAAAYDSGDGLHPNQAGQNALYGLISPLL